MSLHCDGWCQLNNVTFRKSLLYERMKWSNAAESNSRNSLFCSAQFGGPVAIAYTHDASLKVQRSFPIVTYTASGQQIGKIQWQNGELLDIFWSNAEDLLCLQKDGRVFVYSMFGLEKRNRQFGMGNVAQLGITESRSFDSYAGTGLAVLTSSHQFFVVNSVEDPKVWRTPEIPRKAEKPSCWTIVSKGRKTKVIAVFGADIFALTQGLPAEQIVSSVSTLVNRYVRIAVSQDQSKLALLSENGLVQFTSVDMKQTFSETTIDLSDSLPVEFLWCGNEALAVLENDTSLTLLGIDGGSIRFAFDEAIRFGAEVDGIRLFSHSMLEFIAKVPDSVCAVYQVASNEPGALLLEASGKYKEGSHQAYDYLRMVGDRLQQAVEQCVAAAGHEFDIASQRALIEAAAFGKTFARDMNAQSFVDMCRVLRVLNAIRERHFGISLTYEQLSKLTVAVLVDRLIARAQWPLVIAVCQHLRLPPEDGVNRVLGHWACQKIEELKQNRAAGRATTDSAKLADVICRKFREFPGVSYADVAQKAAECELNELATLLLENEPQIDRQVRMLLKLDQRQKALSRATESGDPDLIYLVILKLKQAMDKAELNLMLRKFPDAFILYTQLLREEAPNHLLALYRQEDDFCNQALYHLDSAKAAGTFDVREKQNCLAEAEKSMSAVKEECYSQILSDSVKLLKHQAQFEEQFGQPFTELSLRSTIIWLIEHGENGPAENLRKEFRVGDKQFWWWKIEALGKGGRWQELEAFAKAKKSPIGYLPFVEICVKYKQMSEWKKYLQKMSSHEHQVMANIKTGDLTNAANIAFQNNDDHLLNRVMSHCGPQNRGLSEQILTMKQELAKKSGK